MVIPSLIYLGALSVSDNKRILILNNLCGPLVAMGKALAQLGHQVEFFEADANSLRDLEQAKNAITVFNPDFILQQNFNVYMLCDDFGEQLLSWIESSGVKQLFWFLSRPDCMSRRHTFVEWLEQGYFKSADFFCASKSMMPFFDEHGFKTHYLPIAIEPSIVQPISKDDNHFVTSFFSNTLTGHATWPTATVLESFSNQETALRYFLMAILVSFPTYDQQTIIGSILGPVRQFFSSADIDFASHQLKREKLEKELQHLPAPLILAVLHQVEFVYSDYVSCIIYQKIKPLIQHTSGSTFWDALEQSALNVGAEAPCQLDNVTFKAGNVISFSPFLTMTAPSSAPLSVIASGNLGICEYRAELSGLIPEEYVITYQSVDELVNHISSLGEKKFGLSERKVAAQEYVLTHHTFLQRAKELVGMLNA
jgi:hypothetical protein